MMNQSINQQALIRLALPGEEAAIHAAHMRSINEVCIKDHGEDEVKGWGNRPLGNRWTKGIDNKNVWVIEYQNKIHGLASLDFLSNDQVDEAYIHAIYLTPEVLGKGLGKKLAHILIEKAREQKVSQIRLDSSITAYKFYQKLGFKPNGNKKHLEIGGYPVTCFPMIYNLRKNDVS